jgi:hypothetical protein
VGVTGCQQFTDQCFLSFFHSVWYRSIYLYKKKHVVPAKCVNLEWMATRRHTIINQIKDTCDELEMTKMMSFKYNWNNEIICHFYATMYFDVDAHKLMWMIDRRQYEITVW